MDDTFEVFHRVLSIAGIRIYGKKNWDSKIWLAFQIFNCIIGILIFIFTTGFVAINISEIQIFIDGACIWNTGVIMTISLCVCLYFKKQFRTFLIEMAFNDSIQKIPLIQLVLKLERGKKLMELKHMVISSQEKLFRFTRVVLKCYVTSVFVVASLYLCNPLYLMFVKGDTSLRPLAFDMWLPWSLENMGVYIFSFIFHAYGGYLCCIAYPGMQLTILLLLGQVIRHLKILTFIMQNLTELVEELVQGRDDQWQFYCTSIQLHCFDHYIKLKRFCNRLNVICQPFYLTLILDAIMLVCVCSVKIAISDKLSPDTIKYYAHEFCFIMVVLMFCLMGQQVDTECGHLEQALTEKWYIYDKKHKTNIKIFQLALSHKMPTYIFGTIPLSLPTFTWFIKTGMSFFTLVMSVLDD